MRQTSLHRRPGALYAADMVQLQHFNRSISFYMLLSDKREGSIVPRSTAEMDAEVMSLGMLHSGVAAGGAPARASCRPCSGDPFVEDFCICG